MKMASPLYMAMDHLNFNQDVKKIAVAMRLLVCVFVSDFVLHVVE